MARISSAILLHLAVAPTQSENMNNRKRKQHFFYTLSLNLHFQDIPTSYLPLEARFLMEAFYAFYTLDERTVCTGSKKLDTITHDLSQFMAD